MRGAVKVGVALSGGMDSTMCAQLLLEEGYLVRGYHMLLPLSGMEEVAAQAGDMARSLGIPLDFIDLREDFSLRIITSFTASYRRGLTPNPCMLCNRQIKFGLLAQTMLDDGADFVATGHYARIERTAQGTRLLRGLDAAKDQSYFLARLSQEQLDRMRLPLGEWQKSALRAKGEALGLPLPAGESQDVCFLANGLASFLAGQGFQDAPGEMVDAEGRVLGQHRGVFRYTVGQRRGLNLPDATPWYVCGIDAAQNRLILGKEADLWQSECTVQGLHWLGEALKPEKTWRGLVQIRSRHQAAQAELHRTGPDEGRLCFSAPQRAITPGQFAVFYENDAVLGSAVICKGGRNTVV